MGTWLYIIGLGKVRQRGREDDPKKGNISNTSHPNSPKEVRVNLFLYLICFCGEPLSDLFLWRDVNMGNGLHEKFVMKGFLHEQLSVAFYKSIYL